MIEQFTDEVRKDPVEFADKILGIQLHPGQIKWLKNADKLINFLRPGNRFGKTLSEGIMHIWHATTKPGLFGKARNEAEWMSIDYPTLVFGPEYEQSRELLRLIVDIVEGNLLIPCCPFCDSHRIHKESAKDKQFDCVDCKQKFVEPEHRVNHSLLKGWAIEKDSSNAQLMPHLIWFNNSKTLARSYDEMGKAFKMKALAYITGDECSDIQELYTFTTNTLLPRLINFKGIIHFVGTPQPDGFDYQRMIEMAEEAMQRPNPNMYTQKGSVYENIFVDAAYVQQIEDVADPELRRQIIDGEFVQLGDKYFGFDRIRNMVDPNIVMLKEGYVGRNYLVSVDFAYGSSDWADYTVILVFDYTEEPWKVVYFDRFKAKEVPVPVQYKMVKEIVDNFKARLIIDSSGPGGKNALAFLKEIHPIAFEAGPTGPTSSKKQEGLASLKAALDGAGNTELSRVVRTNPDGTKEDLKKVWGSIRTPNIPELISEMSNYKLDDKRLRTDCVMALMMGVDWLMMRRPKQARNKAVDIDFLDARIDDTPFKEGYFPYGRHKGAVSY